MEEASVDRVGEDQMPCWRPCQPSLNASSVWKTQSSATRRDRQPNPEIHQPCRLPQVWQRRALCSRMCSKEVAGKRPTLGVVGPTFEGEVEMPKQCPPPTTVYSTVSDSSYFVATTINNGRVSFLNDTGSAFTILRKDTVGADLPEWTSLEPVPRPLLV